jgi:hypothetical protein
MTIEDRTLQHDDGLTQAVVADAVTQFGIFIRGYCGDYFCEWMDWDFRHPAAYAVFGGNS